ncbi:MAG: hypothetical protein ACLP4V_22340 [Methylocella sp.]
MSLHDESSRDGTISRRDRGESSDPSRFSHSPAGAESGPSRSASSITGLHESGHVLVARFYGLPVKCATVVANVYFHGMVLGPNSDPDASPETLIADAEALCDQALRNMPGPGEPLDDAAVWSCHATCRCIELLAGYAAEKAAGYAGDNEAGSTDLRIAEIYGATVCSRAALPAFLTYCRTEAAEILRAHWLAIPAIAEALDRNGTLSGGELDELISEAQFQVTRAAELARRKKMKEMTANAENFLADTIGESY